MDFLPICFSLILPARLRLLIVITLLQPALFQMHCDGLFTYMLQFNLPCLFKAVNCNYSSAASPVSNVNCSSPVFTGYCD